MRIMTLIFTSVFEIFIGDMFFKWLGKRKITGMKFFGFFVALSALQVLNGLFFDNSAFIMVNTIIILFLLSLFYKVKFTMRVIGSVIIAIIMAFAEMAVVMLTTVGVKVNIEVINSNDLMYAICVLLSKFMTFVFINILVSRNNNMRQGLTSRFLPPMIVLPGTSLIVIVLLYVCCYRITDDYFRIATLASSVLLAVSNILVFHIINTQGDYISTKEQLQFAKASIESQKEYYIELYEYQREISQFRHDMKNFFTVVLSKLKAGDSEEVEKGIKEKLHIMDESSRSLVNTGNPVLDSILSSKIKQADENNIKIDLTVKLASLIKIDELELGVLLGNALDNAIEATVKIQDRERIIYVSIISVDETMLIKIINPVIENINTDKIETNKHDKKRHGYGLSGIRTITEKYGGILDLNCTDKVFTFTATLCNTSEYK